MIRWTPTYSKFKGILEWNPDAEVSTITVAAGFLALAHVGGRAVLFLAANKPGTFDADFPGARVITQV